MHFVSRRMAARLMMLLYCAPHPPLELLPGCGHRVKTCLPSGSLAPNASPQYGSVHPGALSTPLVRNPLLDLASSMSMSFQRLPSRTDDDDDDDVIRRCCYAADGEPPQVRCYCSACGGAWRGYLGHGPFSTENEGVICCPCVEKRRVFCLLPAHGKHGPLPIFIAYSKHDMEIRDPRLAALCSVCICMLST